MGIGLKVVTIDHGLDVMKAGLAEAEMWLARKLRRNRRAAHATLKMRTVGTAKATCKLAPARAS